MIPIQGPTAASERRIYSLDFLRLQKEHCICVSRTTRRKLQYFRIFVRHIPTRISFRRFNTNERRASPLRKSALITIKKTIKEKPKKCRGLSWFPTIVLANVRALNNKFEEVRLRITNMQPDVVVLTESWLDERTPDSSINISNYSIIRKDRNSKGGGILCYVRSSYNSHVLTTDELPLLAHCCTEILTIFISSFSTLLICVYHPFFNNTAKDEEAINTFVAIIDSFLLTSAQRPDDVRLVLCGDFNDIRKLNNQLCSLTGLKPCVNLPSRGQHFLDQIYVNSSTVRKATLQPPFGRSDHKVVLWRPESAPTVTVSKKMVRVHTKANMAAFMQAAASTDWTAASNISHSVDESADHIQHVIVQLLNSYFPFRTIRVRSSDPIWMKPSLKILLKKRDRAHAKKKWLKYIRLREEAIRHEKFLKARHLQQAMSSQTPRDLWKSINSISRREKMKSSQGNLTAEDLSRYFAGIFQAPSADEESLSLCELPHQLLVLSVNEVEDQQRKIKRKSSGPDGIPYWVLRMLAPLIAPSLTVIFNRSLQDGCFPGCFKLANICPIPKTNEATEASHFLPISLLPILSKTFERLVVRKWISPQLSHIDASQFAYLSIPGRGTACATSMIYHNILRHLDHSSGPVRILSIDFAKAFDKLPHRSILSALVKLRLPFEVVAWIKDFFTNRRQQVTFQSSISEWRSIPSGVPQGSVLGPLLFCAVVSSLQPVYQNSRVVKYADDINLMHFVYDSHEDNLQKELQNIYTWSNEIGLPLTASKSAVMDIVTKSCLSLCPLTDDSGTAFPTANRLKILGVVFENNLRWDAHFDDTIRKASKRIFVIRNLRRSGCHAEVIWRVYQATIQSLLLYGYPCFCNAPQKLINSLEKVERRVARIISDDTSRCQGVVAAGQQLCQRLFQQVLKNADHPLRAFFESRQPTPRNPLTLKKPKSRTVRFKNSFIKFCA